MAFNKKGAPSAKSLSLHDHKSIRPGQDVSGASPVNSKGQLINREGLVIDWPDNPAVHDRDDDVASNFGDSDGQSLDDSYGRSYKNSSYNNGLLGG